MSLDAPYDYCDAYNTVAVNDESFHKPGDFKESSDKGTKTAWQTMTTHDCFQVLLTHCCGLNCKSSTGFYTKNAESVSAEELSDRQRQITWTQINLFAS